MSARKIETNESPCSRTSRLKPGSPVWNFPPSRSSVHKSGIEFRSPTPFNPWTEMTVALQSPRDGSRLQCTGVVIACSGSKHAGYHVSMVFTSLTKQAQARLHAMAGSELGL